VRFFFDNNLSPKLAKSLNVLVAPDHEVVHLKEKFPANTPDDIWMKGLARELDWVIISGDNRITRNPHEVQAWRAAGHTTFFLKPGWTNYSFWVQAYIS
jgi:predicted nuclease of predicted toxin-antitoxin system